MKTFALVALFVAGVTSSTIRIGSLEPVAIRAAPLTVVREIPIVRFSHDIRGAEESNIQYETGNGIVVSANTLARRGLGGGLYQDESGKMVKSDFLIQKTGSYSYTNPEGQLISTNWVADENGFRAEGAHMPKAVEMPAEHAEAHRIALARLSSH